MARATATTINNYCPPPLSKLAAIRHPPFPSMTTAMLGWEGDGRCACVCGTVGVPAKTTAMLGQKGGSRSAAVLAGWQPGIGGIEG
jgi:hypothetical protein